MTVHIILEWWNLAWEISSDCELEQCKYVDLILKLQLQLQCFCQRPPCWSIIKTECNITIEKYRNRNKTHYDFIILFSFVSTWLTASCCNDWSPLCFRLCLLLYPWPLIWFLDGDEYTSWFWRYGRPPFLTENELTGLVFRTRGNLFTAAASDDMMIDSWLLTVGFAMVFSINTLQVAGVYCRYILFRKWVSPTSDHVSRK